MSTKHPASIPTVLTLVEPPVRIILEPSESRRGMLDGAWWPRSRDPVRELEALIGALTSQLGRVYRVGLNHGTWDSHPRSVTAGGHVVKLGWYGPKDLHAIRVHGAYPQPLDLLVIPPEAASEAAEAAMATASDATSHAQATEVLTAHGISAAVPPRAGSPKPPAGREQGAASRPARTAPLRIVAANGTARQNGTRPNPSPQSGTTAQ